MAANPAEIIGQYRAFFERHNPFMQLLIDAKQMLADLQTVQSRRKLSKYRCLLELERLEKLQDMMTSDPSYDPQGVKLDRPF
jgi:hypothetical protein